jgi:hypothetical protein
VLEHAMATERALDCVNASFAAERALVAQMLESLLTEVWPASSR